MRPARNSKCPCSSGKKFKNCCLTLQEERRRWNAFEESLRAKITEFFDSERFASDRLDATLQFTDTPESLKDKATRINFYDWYIHDYILRNNGTTIMRLFTEEMSDALDGLEAETVRLWSNSALRLYEVTGVRKGTGFFAKDVFNDVQLFVHDVSASYNLAIYDLLFARMYRIGTITRTAGSIYLMPHLMLEKIKKFILHQYVSSGCADLDEYFKKNSLSVIKYFDVLKNSKPLYVTPGGSIITISRAEYAIKQAKELLRRFNRSVDLIYAGRLGKKYRYDIVDQASSTDGPTDVIDATSFQTYYVPKNGGPNLKVIANIGFDGKGLEIECMSENRLVESKKIVEGLAGDLLKHRKDTYGIQKDDSPDSYDELDEGQAAEMIEKFFEEYYNSWLQTKIAWLGGKTPLEVSKTANGRELLKDLIKNIENVAHHNGWEDAPFIKKLKSKLELN